MQLNRKWWLGFVLILAACASPSPKGTLNLTLSAEGLSPKVQVTGPGDYNREFTVSARVADLEPGPYTLTPQTVKANGFSYSAAPQTQQVRSGQTTNATIAYAATTGRLAVTVVADSLPAGVVPRIEVRRPDNSLVDTLNATRTLDDLAPNTYSLSFSTNGTLPSGTSVVATLEGGDTPSIAGVAAGETKAVTVRYVLNPGSLRVNVAGLTGTASPAGSLSLTRSVAGATPITRPVSANSAVNFEGLEPGQYSLEASVLRLGGQRFSAGAAQSVTISSGQETVVAATYAAISGIARITVAGLAGTASPASSVTLTRSGATPITRPVSANGELVFEDLEFGSYAVTATNLTFLNQVFVPNPANLTPSISLSAGTSTTARTLNYVRPSLELTFTGLPAGSATISVQLGRGVSNTVTGTERTRNVTVPTLETYSISATAAVGGALYTAPAVSVTPSELTPTPSATLAFATATSSGGIFAVGNGNISNTGMEFSNGSGAAFPFNFSATPGVQRGLDSVFRVLSGTSAGAVDAVNATGPGAFKVQFSPVSGDMFILYQAYRNLRQDVSADSGSSNRVVRIPAANVTAGNFATGITTLNIGAALAVGTELSPSDMAFDATGNLWLSNLAGRIGCVAVANLSVSATTAAGVAFAQIINPVVGEEANYIGLDALAFDSGGNLWFSSGRYTSGINGNSSRLNRIPVASLTCAGGSSAITPDVRLDISAVSSDDPFFDPKDLVFVPGAGGGSLWVADGGAGNDIYTPSASDTPNPPTVAAGCNLSGTPDLIDPTRESVMQIPLSGGNVTPNTAAGLKLATLGDRISVAATVPTASKNKGMQQAFGLTFDGSGNLWVATNNHVEVDETNVCFPSLWIDFPSERALRPNRPVRSFADYLLTDRQGKLYRFDASQLASGATSGGAIRNLTPAQTLSAPIGNGLTGVTRVITPPVTP